MAELGTKLEPGIVTDVSSATTVSTGGASRSDVGIVGQADLGAGATEGSADPNEVYLVTRSTDARTWFGDDSLLTEAVIDALNEGAFPVYAVATEETQVTGEDLSGLSSTSGTLAEGPADEDATNAQFTIDGVSKTTTITYEDPATLSPDADEVLLNPVTQDFELDAAPSDGDDTNDTVDYVAHDYPTANQALVDGVGETIDFFVALSENESVTADVQTKVGNMAQEYNFALAIVGAGARIDPMNYENQFDDSRMQVLYPTRGADDKSILGAYAGKRAALGITTTPINKRLESEKKLSVGLDKGQRGELIDSRVVPLAQESAGARIADDVNSVSDDNSEEANIRYGFSRLVIDVVIKTVHTNERPFIGRLNSQAVRSTLEGLLTSQLKPLLRSNAILDYNVTVRKVDATTATVELGVETAKPLRFIENEVAVGGVQ
jgi:hypothetical protein